MYTLPTDTDMRSAMMISMMLGDQDAQRPGGGMLPQASAWL